MCASNTLLFREQLWGLSSLETVGYRTRDGVYGKIVSQPLLPTLMWAFPCLPDTQESFRQQPLVFFSEDVGPYIAADSVCLWDVLSPGSSCVVILK